MNFALSFPIIPHLPKCKLRLIAYKKAIADRDEFGWQFLLHYGLDEAQMRSLSHYVSSPLSVAETDSLLCHLILIVSLSYNGMPWLLV